MARLGGDEFGVILSEVGDAEEVLRRLRDIIEHEVEVSGLPLSVESSIGYVVAPDDGIDVDDLLQHADVAMYVAKAQHAGRGALRRRPRPLRRRPTSGSSPICAAPSTPTSSSCTTSPRPPSKTDGSRRSRRWCAGSIPPLGLLYPDRFIPLCEQTDLIDKLTTWVMRTALTDVRDLGDVAVSVNVSARTLGRGALRRAGHRRARATSASRPTG